MSVATHHGGSTATPFSSPSPVSVLAPRAPPLSGPPAQPPPPPPAPLQLTQDPPLLEGPTRGGPPAQPPPPPPAPLLLDQDPPLSEGPSRAVPLSVGQPLLPTSVVEQQPAVTSVVNPPTPTGSRTKRARLSAAVLAGLILVELWAGVASLSTSFLDAGHSLYAFCEANPLLHSLLSLLHPDSLTALKSELGEWSDWVFPEGGGCVAHWGSQLYLAFDSR